MFVASDQSIQLKLSVSCKYLFGLELVLFIQLDTIYIAPFRQIPCNFKMKTFFHKENVFRANISRKGTGGVPLDIQRNRIYKSKESTLRRSCRRNR